MPKTWNPVTKTELEFIVESLAATQKALTTICLTHARFRQFSHH